MVALVACGRLHFDDLVVDGKPASCTWSAFSTPQPLPAVVQSSVDDWGPTPTLGGTELFFYSYRGVGSSTLWHAPTDPYAAAIEESELDGGAFNVKYPALPDDALDIIYGLDNGTGYQLVEATRTSTLDAFGAPVAIAELASGGNDFAPALTPDGLRLVFTSDRAMPSGQDLLYETSRVDRASPFAPPVELAELGPLATDDTFPGATLSSDALDLFVAMKPGSRVHIFHAHRTAIGQPFSTPTQVNELSSAKDDGLQHLSADGATMFLDYDTDQNGGQNAELYSATRTCQ